MIFNMVYGQGGGGAGATLTVTAPNGSTITVSNGEKTYTKTGGTAEFSGLTTGTWTVTATDGVNTRTETVEVDTEYNVTIQSLAKAFGYRHYTANSSPELIRLGNAVGLTATAGIGTVAQVSDFDDQPIFRDIRVCNLAADGTVNAYEGDPGFTRDGTNGDVMVEIPRFYYKRIQGEDETGAYVESWVSDGRPDDEYEIHPAFHRGAPYDDLSHIYVAAYETSDGYVSKTGVAPLVNITRAAARTGSKGKETGWSQLDIAAVCAVNLLIYTEYATLNGQTAIGSGNSDTSAAIKTGTTDSMAGHTGRAAGTDTSVGMKWRGIENWWGNVWKLVDGLNVNGGAYYYCISPDSYADDTATGYTKASYTVGTNLSQSYIKTMGLDQSAPWLRIPSAGGGSATTYYCDGCWTGTGWHVARLGGRYSSDSLGGPSAWAFSSTSSDVNVDTGSRLLYIPQEVSA